MIPQKAATRAIPCAVSSLRAAASGINFSSKSSSQPGDVDLDKEQQWLASEASFLTRSLFRTCIRSARLIRYGNEEDEKNFTKMENDRERRLDDSSPSRISMLSMLPPVDREDELRSRYEYYSAFAKENFVQESDIFRKSTTWDRRQVSRYLYHLRRGDEQRRWLLSDMKFDDPYATKFDKARTEQFEKRALKHVGVLGQAEIPVNIALAGDDSDLSDLSDEDIWSDDEDNDHSPPPRPLR